MKLFNKLSKIKKKVFFFENLEFFEIQKKKKGNQFSAAFVALFGGKKKKYEEL